MIEDIKNLVKKTASTLDVKDRLTLAIYSMGISGEIGEVIEAYPRSKDDFKMELADLVWYTVALSRMLDTKYLLEDIDFNSNNLVDGRDGEEFLYEALLESLKHLEKAKKYVRDYPSRPIESLNGYIKPLKMISDIFNLSDTYDILNKKLGARYPGGFVINPVR